MTVANRGSPLNVAHRGASREAPENTLAAFRRAVELGADGIELDVHLSKDRELVVIHDLTLEATTDGRGFVRDHTLAELKKLDAGSWFGPAFSGERIPRLEEVIDAFGQQLLLNLELKASERADGSGEELSDAVVHLIDRYCLWDRVLVSSFSQRIVEQVKRRCPRIPTGLLYDSASLQTLHAALALRRISCDALHPHDRLVDEGYMRWARQLGYRVIVWTVDEPARMQALIGLGVDAIITNRPETLDRVLGSKRQGGDRTDLRWLPASSPPRG
jgi:glycerophosphoryl diester phosphodiesterase